MFLGGHFSQKSGEPEIRGSVPKDGCEVEFPEGTAPRNPQVSV